MCYLEGVNYGEQAMTKRPHGAMAYNSKVAREFRVAAIHRHGAPLDSIWYYGDGKRVLACKVGYGDKGWAEWRLPNAPAGMEPGQYSDYFLPTDPGMGGE
jgi:hypothetical protein